MDSNPYWLAVGFLGQAFFSMRFIWQWLYSEYRKRSVIPMAFWYFSLLGGARCCCTRSTGRIRCSSSDRAPA